MAVAQRADAIECDLQLTADNQIVICHDTTLERYGHSGVRIGEITLVDLQQLDMGSWFAAKFSQQRLLSLEEMLSGYGSIIRLCLEVKTDELTESQCDVLVKKLTDSVCSHQLQNQIVFLGFDSKTMQHIRNVAPWAWLALNTHEPHQIDESALHDRPWLNGVDGNIKQLSKPVVEMLHRHELASLTFTCDSKDDVLKAWDLGVDAIITGDPEYACEIIRQHRQQNIAS